jgi:hypothetical protein
VDYAAPYVLINSAAGRRKNRNMARRAQVALSIQDPDNAYCYLAIRGYVAEITEEGADAHIDALALRYLGTPYPASWRGPGEVRQIFKIAIERVITRVLA